MSPAGLLRALALSMLLLLVARIARAELAVALIEPSTSTEAEHRAFVQLRAELDSGGYAVVVVDGARFQPEVELESAAGEANSRAAIRLRRDGTGLVAEIWTRPAPSEPGELATARAEGESIEASRTLALRSVEILRGRGLSPDEPEERAPPREKRFSVGLGLEVLGHPSGLPTAVATMLTLGFRMQPLRFEFRALSAAESRLVEPEGKASFDQQLLLGSLRVDLFFDARISPFVGISGGAYALTGESNTLPGLRGTKSQVVWTAAFGGLAGGSVRVYDSDALAVELVGRFDCLWLSPQPVVRFVERPVAKAGQPLLAGAFGAEVLF